MAHARATTIQPKGLHRYQIGLLFLSLACGNVLARASIHGAGSLGWALVDSSLLFIVGIMLVAWRVNLHGPITLSDEAIRKGTKAFDLATIDWERVDPDADRVVLAPRGKPWADRIRIDLRKFDEGLRVRLRELKRRHS